MGTVDMLRLAEEVGMSNTEIAGAMDVAERTIFRWKGAKTTMPRYLQGKLRAVLSNRLNARISYLADRYDELQEPEVP